jgi:hypothetical protein
MTTTKRAQKRELAMKALKRLDCTVEGRGPWKVEAQEPKRRVIVVTKRRGNRHIVYYGTRTGRTLADALMQATALAAVLNVLKTKTC